MNMKGTQDSSQPSMKWAASGQEHLDFGDLWNTIITALLFNFSQKFLCNLKDSAIFEKIPEILKPSLQLAGYLRIIFLPQWEFEYVRRKCA